MPKASDQKAASDAVSTCLALAEAAVKEVGEQLEEACRHLGAEVHRSADAEDFRKELDKVRYDLLYVAPRIGRLHKYARSR